MTTQTIKKITNSMSKMSTPRMPQRMYSVTSCCAEESAGGNVVSPLPPPSSDRRTIFRPVQFVNNNHSVRIHTAMQPEKYDIIIPCISPSKLSGNKRLSITVLSRRLSHGLFSQISIPIAILVVKSNTAFSVLKQIKVNLFSPKPSISSCTCV